MSHPLDVVLAIAPASHWRLLRLRGFSPESRGAVNCSSHRSPFFTGEFVFCGTKNGYIFIFKARALGIVQSTHLRPASPSARTSFEGASLGWTS